MGDPLNNHMTVDDKPTLYLDPLSTHGWASNLHKMKFTSTGDPQNNHIGEMTNLYLDHLLSALSAMEDIQDTYLHPELFAMFQLVWG